MVDTKGTTTQAPPSERPSPATYRLRGEIRPGTASSRSYPVDMSATPNTTFADVIGNARDSQPDGWFAGRVRDRIARETKGPYNVGVDGKLLSPETKVLEYTEAVEGVERERKFREPVVVAGDKSGGTY